MTKFSQISHKNRCEFEESDERKPAILSCTTAATGMPQGVEYTRRGVFLRSLLGMAWEFGSRRRK